MDVGSTPRSRETTRMTRPIPPPIAIVLPRRPRASSTCDGSRRALSLKLTRSPLARRWPARRTSVSGEEEMTSAITTARLTKDYGARRGIFDLDLDVSEGEVFGF